MDNYRGIPLDHLEINQIEWSDADTDHIRTRSKRKHPKEPDIEPEFATEAALDPLRRVGLPSSGPSLEVVGHSPSMDRVLKVWLLPIDLEAGRVGRQVGGSDEGSAREGLLEAD